MRALFQICEDVRNAAVQPLRDLVHALQCRALLPIFQPVERGLGNAQLTGKPGVGGIAALFAEKSSELLIQRRTHTGYAAISVIADAKYLG